MLVQVVVLVVEALTGLATGQQGVALLARLDSVRTLKEEHDEGVAKLVASGKVGSSHIFASGCFVSLQEINFQQCPPGQRAHPRIGA